MSVTITIMVINLCMQIGCVVFTLILFRRWGIPFGWFLSWILIMLLLLVTRRVSSLSAVLAGHTHDALNHVWLPLGITVSLCAAMVTFGRAIDRWLRRDPSTRVWLLREVNKGIFDRRRCDAQLAELRRLQEEMQRDAGE